jgi:hypothetical protein
VYVGASTAVVIAGNKLLPSLGDWYLGKTGYASQQYDGAPPRERSNLWQPVDDTRDFGAHGSFTARAHGRSLELWAAKHKRTLFGVAAAAALAAWMAK